MSNRQQQIIDAVSTRLAAITGVKGAHIWRKTPLTPADCPCLLLFDTSADSDIFSITGRMHHLTVELIGMVTSKTTASQARQLGSDIMAAIGTDDTWGGLALKTDAPHREITLETDGDITGAVKITLDIQYRTELWNI